MNFKELYVLYTTILIGIMTFMNGCTTTSHEPECKCKCTEVDATFECGGIHYTQELEIK